MLVTIGATIFFIVGVFYLIMIFITKKPESKPGLVAKALIAIACGIVIFYVPINKKKVELPTNPFSGTVFDTCYHEPSSQKLLKQFGSMAEWEHKLIPIYVQTYGDPKKNASSRSDLQWGYSIAIDHLLPQIRLSSRTLKSAIFQSGGVQISEIYIGSCADTSSSEWQELEKIPY